ncbi:MULTISPECIES: hypothetical protein [unclassified Clostridium]|uniref:hypothetical protein n=1 Tax=unclassified Clostridium TaxID=2614128 RepID=UPI000E8077BF|nr:hypothetical protein [Clostridium sp.]HBA04903.1 hypothetical protein [Clostridium sp.]
MVYLDIILKILGILSLITFMIIIIWGFVVFNSIYSQLRYSNYILEKISHILNISCIDMQAKEKEQQKKSEIIDENSNSELLDSTSDSTI